MGIQPNQTAGWYLTRTVMQCIGRLKACLALACFHCGRSPTARPTLAYTQRSMQLPVKNRRQLQFELCSEPTGCKGRTWSLCIQSVSASIGFFFGDYVTFHGPGAFIFRTFESVSSRADLRCRIRLVGLANLGAGKEKAMGLALSHNP